MPKQKVKRIEASQTDPGRMIWSCFIQPRKWFSIIGQATVFALQNAFNHWEAVLWLECSTQDLTKHKLGDTASIQFTKGIISMRKNIGSRSEHAGILAISIINNKYDIVFEAYIYWSPIKAMLIFTIKLIWWK